MGSFIKNLEFWVQKSMRNNFVNNENVSPVFEPLEKERLLNDREIARTIIKDFNIEKVEETYNLLNDDYSRDLLIQVFIYKFFLGPSKHKLPLADKILWMEMFDIEKLCKKEEAIQVPGFILNLFDLSKIGHNYRIFSTAESLFLKYISGEYEYRKNNINFMAEEGDYVIDGGAYVGDTTLYFADLVGEKGKVFSFEFEDGNLITFNKNMELNPHLQNRIQNFKNALWSNSKEFLYSLPAGPGSSVTMEEPPYYTNKIPSKSIDDLVEEQNISKIDFIKLDIEGAELECLKGAKKTIDKFKPKLAVCLYHKPEDFTTIPQYLAEIHPYYNFYMNHHTAYVWETVLYAVPKK